MRAETAAAGLPVTHDLSEAGLLGHQVGVIDGGHVIQHGAAPALAAQPASARSSPT